VHAMELELIIHVIFINRINLNFAVYRVTCHLAAFSKEPENSNSVARGDMRNYCTNPLVA